MVAMNNLKGLRRASLWDAPGAITRNFLSAKLTRAVFTRRLLFRRFFRPRIAECGDTIENRLSPLGIDRVGEEVSQPLKLKMMGRLRRCERRLQVWITKDFKRVLIYVF